jgi:hypothetical protein
MSRIRRLSWLLLLATLVLGGSGHGGGGLLASRAASLRSDSAPTATRSRDVLRRPEPHADYIAAARRNDRDRANGAAAGRFAANRAVALETARSVESNGSRRGGTASTVGSRAPPTRTSTFLR